MNNWADAIETIILPVLSVTMAVASVSAAVMVVLMLRAHDKGALDKSIIGNQAAQMGERALWAFALVATGFTDSHRTGILLAFIVACIAVLSTALWVNWELWRSRCWRRGR